MLLRARKRHIAARASTCLLVGVSLVVPASAAAEIVPPVALPGVAGAVPAVPSPTALASSVRCRHAGARRASAAKLRRAMLLPGQPHAHAPPASRPSAASATWPAPPSRHAADMGRRHYFAHVSPSGKSPLSRARAAGWRGGVGEVIAWGCGTLSSPARDAPRMAQQPAAPRDPPRQRAPRRRRRQAHRRLRRPRLLGDGPGSAKAPLGRARLPGEAADRQRQAGRRPHAEHEQRDEVVADALAGDHRPLRARRSGA